MWEFRFHQGAAFYYEPGWVVDIIFRRVSIKQSVVISYTQALEGVNTLNVHPYQVLCEVGFVPETLSESSRLAKARRATQLFYLAY